MENGLFNGCANLVNIQISGPLLSIEEKSFYGCINLENSITEIGRVAFSDCTRINHISLPQNLSSIQPETFSGCENLSSIIIPDDVTVIGDYAFADCKDLSSVIIPNNVRSIGIYAFSSCSQLTDITIPAGVNILCGSAFADCTSLMRIRLPNSVTSLGIRLFENCTHLTDIYYSGTRAEWDAISIGIENSELQKVLIHYGCTEGIRSVTMQQGENAYDILKQQHLFDVSCSDTVIFTVEADWGNSHPGKIILAQKDKTFESTDGSFPPIQLNTSFDAIQNIYVLMIDSSGNLIDRQKTLLRIDSADFHWMPIVYLKPDANNIRYLNVYPDRTVRPDGPVSRYDLLYILSQLFSIEAVGQELFFSDIDSAHANSVKLFTASNLMNGFPDGTFRGNFPVTRAELVKVLCKCLSLDASGILSPLLDTHGHWADEYIGLFFQKGYIIGYPDNTFHPDESITRAEMVVLLNHITRLKPDKTVLPKYQDLPYSHWAFMDIMAVTKE